MRWVLFGALTVCLGFGLSSLIAAEEKADAPKVTIKQVMKEAHKDGLLEKIATGKGNKEDAQKILELYTALGANKPPKGDADSWKTKTEALAKAAKDVVDGKDGAPAKLKATANCAGCHGAHKPA